MIYDCFLLFNELDVLEVRLIELYPVVDRFVLVESMHTHKGDPKPLWYGMNRHRFAAFNDKIIHVVVSDMPGGDGIPAIRRREMYQRNQILQGLIDAPDDSLILVSDADEIPRRETIQWLAAQAFPDGCVASFIQTLHYYNLNTRAVNRPWPGTRAAKLADVRCLSPHIIRNGMGQPDAHYPLHANIMNAGWHYSYLGDVRHIQNKMRQFLHQELVTEENTEPSAIAEKIAAGVDLWGRESEQDFEIGAAFDLPIAIRCNPKKYLSYFHPDWQPVFHEDWCQPEMADALGVFARMAPREGAIVEIGCWEGRSTVALAQAVAPRLIHCVDHWEGNGDEGDGQSVAAAQERDVQETFAENIAKLTSGNVRANWNDWRDWIVVWGKYGDNLTGDTRIAFLYLDASHDYQSVYDCLMAIKPYLMPGSLVCGDDAYADGVYRGVRDALGENVGEVSGRLWLWRNGDGN